MSFMFKRTTLNKSTVEKNLAKVDTWMADTADKLNVQFKKDIMSFTNEQAEKLKAITDLTMEQITNLVKFAKAIEIIENWIEETKKLLEEQFAKDIMKITNVDAAKLKTLATLSDDQIDQILKDYGS